MIEQYKHHGNIVFVDTALRGKHREHCLCFKCKKFNIDDRDLNCVKANLLYALCVAHGMVTPVYECPIFDEK